MISIGFVLLSLFLSENKTLQGFLKIRGIFRLFRVFILIRKLNAVRIRRDLRKRHITAHGYDLRSPLEKVLEILSEFRNAIDISESKLLVELNYAIKMISTNKLYEADIDLDEQQDELSDKTSSVTTEANRQRRKAIVSHKQEVMSWVGAYSAQNKDANVGRKRVSGSAILKDSIFADAAYDMPIDSLINFD